MKVKVEENRKLIFLNKPGTQNENDVTTLEIEVPEKYEDYNKKIVFITADGVVWDIIENNTYILKKSITKYRSVEFYIWLTKGTEDFRSETKTLRLNKNIDPNGEMTEEEINGINKLLNEIEEIKKEIDNIEITGGGIVEENDPTVPQYVKDIKEEDIQKWNNKSTDGSKEIYVGAEEPTGEETMWIDPTEEPDEIPTKTSELENDSGFITEIPEEYATKEFVNTAIQNALEVVENGTY